MVRRLWGASPLNKLNMLAPRRRPPKISSPPPGISSWRGGGVGISPSPSSPISKSPLYYISPCWRRPSPCLPKLKCRISLSDQASAPPEHEPRTSGPSIENAISVGCDHGRRTESLAPSLPPPRLVAAALCCAWLTSPPPLQVSGRRRAARTRPKSRRPCAAAAAADGAGVGLGRSNVGAEEPRCETRLARLPASLVPYAGFSLPLFPS